MDSAGNRAARLFTILVGVVLVGLFVTWPLLRNHEAIRSSLGMDTEWGWVAHVAVWLILLGGVALLAHGIFGRRRSGPDLEE
jgi:hypothetical protein